MRPIECRLETNRILYAITPGHSHRDLERLSIPRLDIREKAVRTRIAIQPQGNRSRCLCHINIKVLNEQYFLSDFLKEGWPLTPYVCMHYEGKS